MSVLCLCLIFHIGHLLAINYCTQTHISIIFRQVHIVSNLTLHLVFTDSPFKVSRLITDQASSLHDVRPRPRCTFI